MSPRTCAARREDATAIARIYNEGIEDRLATFETEPRTEADIGEWLEDGIPLVVAEDGDGVVAWAAAHPYRPAREAYRGIGEFSVYVARDRRSLGAGRAALAALIEAAGARGYWKLPEPGLPGERGQPCAGALAGFREVGVYRRHGRLDGVWRDVVIVERLLGEVD